MIEVPKDITDTLERRWFPIRIDDLDEEFHGDPMGTLESVAEEYRTAVHAVDPAAASTHHDWGGRIDIEPENSLPLSRLDVSLIRRYVVFRGIVSRARQPKPRETLLTYVCVECGETATVRPEGIKPRKCRSCKSSLIMPDEAMTEYVDSQMVQLMEPFDEISGSRQPMQLMCRFDGTASHFLVKPGERYAVGGVLTARISAKRDTEYLFLANNAVPFEQVVELPVPEIKGDVMAALVGSFAPHIHGHETIKEAIILQQAGGTARRGGRTDINILLVGDPGMAKSTLLREAVKVAPNGWQTSGKGATAAGLAAGMARDQDGMSYLEPGIAVLADRGLLAIDEFDKISEDARSTLHETMEQQSVSISKVGMSVTLNARNSVLAAANPREGIWDDSLTLAENIDLPQSLLTRFDLIFNVRDIPDTDSDRQIVRHILTGGGESPELGPREITGYINSVRGLNPVLSGEAMEAIEQYYARMRMEAGDIRITPRQAEAVRRLAGARAKLYRREEITIEDATRAIRLIETMIERTFVDPETGKPSYAKAVGVATGKPKSGLRAVDAAVSRMNGDFTANDVSDFVEMDFPDLERALEKLHDAGVLLEPSPGVYRRIA